MSLARLVLRVLALLLIPLLLAPAGEQRARATALDVAAGPAAPEHQASAHIPPVVKATQPGPGAAANPSLAIIASPRVAPVPAPRQRIQVPILMYHYIRVNPDPSDRIGFNLSVPPPDFAAQMDYLAARGYRVVGLDEVAGYLTGEREDPPPPGTVALTFDDGYADAYEAAYPILKQHGFRATIFVISGLAGWPGYLTWDQMRQIAAGGITFGAHTVTHPDLRRVSHDRAVAEITESKATLERELGAPARFFAYPSGRYNGEIVDIVKAAGYQAAVTTKYGRSHGPEDLYTLTRVRVTGGQSLETLVKNAGLYAGPPTSPAAPPPPTPPPPHANPSPRGGPARE